MWPVCHDSEAVTVSDDTVTVTVGITVQHFGRSAPPSSSYVKPWASESRRAGRTMTVGLSSEAPRPSLSGVHSGTGSPTLDHERQSLFQASLARGETLGSVSRGDELPRPWNLHGASLPAYGRRSERWVRRGGSQNMAR